MVYKIENRLVNSMKEALEYVKGDLHQGKASRHETPKAMIIEDMT